MSEENQETETAPTEDTVEQGVERVAEAVAIQASQLGEFAAGMDSEEGLGLAGLMDVPVMVTVEVGRMHMTLGRLVKLGAGSLVTLDRQIYEPADILVNGKIVARGEIVTIDQNYGVRITSVET